MKKTHSALIGNVKLELLRPGPTHNQLLSPLTPYIALCGADGPVTIRIPFEHRQLLTRLRRLRYPTEKNSASDEQRQSEVRDIGEAIGGVLGQVPALLTELGNACMEGSKLIHLRLSLSGFELGMIPFEAAVAPDGFPGSGSPLFLQMRAPITITREIRRGRPLPVEWNRKPRILFAYATPDNFTVVPHRAHLQALREAIEPWVKIKDKDTDRLDEVKEQLTILPNASLEAIHKECATNDYTHVHILAHGALFKSSGEDHYGIALCNGYDQTADIVDGERLAIALTARDSFGAARFRPTVVTLATCDSGNIETVITPGGSIAHELNAAGIPWVVASQFPLWMKTSAIATEVLYKGLLSGEDPRWVLYDLRQHLRTDSPGTHDWASIVAYSTLPWNFEQQMSLFRFERTRSKIEVKLDRIDNLDELSKKSENPPSENHESELFNLIKSIETELKKWREELDESSSPQDVAKLYAISAASYKRIGIAYSHFAEKDSENKEENKKKSRQAYETSRDFYKTACKAEPANLWFRTQYLSLLAVLELVGNANANTEELRKQYGKAWGAACQLAQWQCDAQHQNTADEDITKEDRIWTLTILAELALLGAVYGEQKADIQQLKEDIKRHCDEIRELADSDAFALQSTIRQFTRYSKDWECNIWQNLADKALEALKGKESGLTQAVGVTGSRLWLA